MTLTASILRLIAANPGSTSLSVLSQTGGNKDALHRLEKMTYLVKVGKERRPDSHGYNRMATLFSITKKGTEILNGIKASTTAHRSKAKPCKLTAIVPSPTQVWPRAAKSKTPPTISITSETKVTIMPLAWNSEFYVPSVWHHARAAGLDHQRVASRGVGT